MTIKKKSSQLPFKKIGISLLIIASLVLLYPLVRPRPQLRRVPYSFFLLQVKAGKVESVGVSENLIVFQLKPEGNSKQGVVLSTPPIEDLELPERLEKQGVKVQFIYTPPPKNKWLGTLLSWIVPSLIVVGGFQYLRNRENSQDKQSLAFGKSKAKVYIEGQSEKITFADVAGVEEAKVELQEIVEFLKNPDRFTQIGARIPKGVLLVGPPGTGKTLLAKAVAGEAGVSFFSISASEFVELFVGTGAARVRDLFEQAKQKAPCIIFIDELDAIGKSRNSGATSGSNDEREQTLNQLLTEMDGFGVGDATVIVLAATNRPEALDAALLRPGRFDRQVLVDRPDFDGRLKILEVYARKVKLGEDINLKEIATQTSGFAGADLANLVNEAALLAARERRTTVSQRDFKEAIERVIIGLERKSRVLSEKEKKIVAYHEVGHALVGALMPGGTKVAKISIVPRGSGALGYMLAMPEEDRFLLDEADLRDKIATLLGGRAAEAIIFGKVTTGASDDLQRATNLAERMVTSYGMSRVLGPLAYDRAPTNNFLGNEGGNLRRALSEKTAEAIDVEVKEIVERAYEQALEILKVNRELLEEIAQQLMKTEVIEGEALQTYLARTRSVSQ
ncbi:ATP-dependent zinc metalloprotease FtsH [Oscillatoria sp. FACHB-1406]|uniref:ATP-dependent zinc metalloprotease FtsH n=1 Tax=Oscillatoria sp. FACHB-1406 TaxID=2692846 RepID=UPI0016881319|nr:ATP-dependent zinc metalloprotease FtsH [Oscillatoria sp. FACHB-1406]MBD2576902.1 ATP-dependent zinc metalloprotease FtsH [Oscillatoria sp. FACHB-1406]